MWEIASGSLAPGERLLLHSDGLTEARNATEREFGDAWIETVAGWHPAANAQSLIDTLIGEWRIFMGDQPADDDVSIAVLRYNMSSRA